MGDPRDVDLFEVIGRIPKGRVYQWVMESVAGNTELPRRIYQQFRRAGWKSVPAKRHPKMPRRGRQIVVGGQVLMEKDAAKAAAAREREILDARRMAGENEAGKYIGTDFARATDDPRWTAQEPIFGAFPSTDGLPRTVDVVLRLKLGHNLVEAAAVCHLPVEEYARRMIALILRGDLDGILQPTLERDAWEVRHLTTEKSK